MRTHKNGLSQKATNTEFARQVTGGLSDADHERLVKAYVKLKPDERVEVHNIQTKLSQKRRDDLYDRAHPGAFYYGMFLLAIREYLKLQNRAAEFTRMTPKEAAARDRAQEIRKEARSARKASVAFDLVQRRFDKIRELRDKGTSWRAIAELLAKGKKGAAISHTSLIANFNKVAYERGLT